MRENKSRALVDKQITVGQAVSRYIQHGNFLAAGGFGHVRIPMALIYEIIHQGIGGLTMAGKFAVHDIDLLVAAGCVMQAEAAYAFGH